MTTTTTRHIGGQAVGAIGLGCMNLSHAYATPPAADAAEALLLQALDLGVVHFDTAALYGFGANETLVGRVLQPHRSRIVLASKGGMAGVESADGVVRRVIDGRPEAIGRNCDDSLRRLRTDAIDLYYLHRWDKRVPIEDSVGAVSRLVEAGKVRWLGLSEVSAPTLLRAHAVHPVTAVQTEYSLWTRNPEIAVLDACRAIGATFVAFSPLARGFLTAEPPDPAGFGPQDIRRSMPRFAADHWAANRALLPAFHALAADVGCTAAQLALAWLLTRGDHVLPIPGTTSPQHLRDNTAAARVTLTPGQADRAGALIDDSRVAGNRYGAQARAEVDTEERGERA